MTPLIRILVADDNRDAADCLAALLRLDGYALRVAYDGPAAIAMAREFEPQVAILDIGMPGLDGHGVARAIRAEVWGACMHLIALTGWNQLKDRQLSSAAGFDHHFCKPLEPERLAAVLSELRARHAGPREA